MCNAITRIVNKYRNYGEYSSETTVIEKFEEYEESLNISYGDEQEDFLPQFELFRAGFIAGGVS